MQTFIGDDSAIVGPMDEISAGAGWPELRDALVREPGTVMFIGNTDTGKTTLIRWLVTECVGRGVMVALVDADVGQSGSCLPGTVGMCLLARKEEEYRCRHFSFLGSASPVKVIPSLLKATGYYVQAATWETAMILLDTSGLVAGDLGLGLKLAKVRITAPLHLVALQRGDECEHILARLDGPILHRLHPHPYVRIRTREQRARARNDRLVAYFGSSPLREVILQGGEMELLQYGRSVSLHHYMPNPGTVLGIGKGVETSALGIVTEADAASIVCRFRKDAVVRGKSVVVGDVMVEV